MACGGRPGARAREDWSERWRRHSWRWSRVAAIARSPAARSRARRATRRCATATRCSATSPSPATSSTARAPDAQRQPGRAEARPLPADRRHADQAPGARLGARRRLQRRRQDERGAGRRGEHVRQAGLRRGLDQLPAARRPGCVGQPGTAACTIAALEAQHDAQAAVRWLRANAAHVRHRPDADRDRRRVRRRDHRDAGRPALRGPRQQRQPRLPLDACGGFVSVSGGLPSGALRRAPATPRACSSTARPTAGRAVQWSDRHRRGDARRGRARPGSSTRTARATCPRRSTARSTSSRRTTSSTWRSTWPTPAGQPTAAARAYGAPARSAWRRARGRSGC